MWGTRLRRVCIAVLVLTMVLAVAGCTVGRATIPKDSVGGVYLSCDPARIAEWLPGAGAVRWQLEVLETDASQPLQATEEDWQGSGVLGVVFDGTKPTGPVTADVVVDPPGAFFKIAPTFGAALLDIHIKWMLTALDTAGNDVGAKCFTGA